ncbi:hypothetical protein C8R43DRAFT_1051296 [Mycena crocata]|nr:hypothetical protein C8R43DRAFT_1051296 [Mycena crocata]
MYIHIHRLLPIPVLCRPGRERALCIVSARSCALCIGSRSRALSTVASRALSIVSAGTDADPKVVTENVNAGSDAVAFAFAFASTLPSTLPLARTQADIQKRIVRSPRLSCLPSNSTYSSPSSSSYTQPTSSRNAHTTHTQPLPNPNPHRRPKHLRQLPALPNKLRPLRGVEEVRRGRHGADLLVGVGGVRVGGEGGGDAGGVCVVLGSGGVMRGSGGGVVRDSGRGDGVVDCWGVQTPRGRRRLPAAGAGAGARMRYRCVEVARGG